MSNSPLMIAWKYHGSVGNVTIDYDETGAFGGGQLTNITGTAIAPNNDPAGCDPPSASGIPGLVVMYECAGTHAVGNGCQIQGECNDRITQCVVGSASTSALRCAGGMNLSSRRGVLVVGE